MSVADRAQLRLLDIFWGMIVVLQLWDVLTTHYAMGIGGHEANPFAQQIVEHPLLMLGAKAVLTVGAWALIRLAFIHFPGAWTPWISSSVVLGGMSVVVVNNTHLILTTLS